MFGGQFHNHPPGNVSSIEVDEHIELIIDPFGRAHELGDIPAPQLTWRSRHQLRLLIAWVSPLVPALTNLPVSAHNAVHGPQQAEIFLFIKQGRIDGTWRLIGKPLTVERPFHLLDL
jgi:hypothetical protein